MNRAPAVDVLNPFGGADGPAATNLAVRVDQELAINGHLEDDGLRAAGKVTSTWKKISAPGDAVFSDTPTGPTRVKFTAPGAHVIELSATDGDKANSLKVNVIVS